MPCDGANGLLPGRGATRDAPPPGRSPWRGMPWRRRERVVARACGRRGLTRAGTDGRGWPEPAAAGACAAAGAGRAGAGRAGAGVAGAGAAGGSRARRAQLLQARGGGASTGAAGAGAAGAAARRGGRRACRCLRGGCCCGGGTSATDRVGVPQLADDRRFDGRGCRADELTELVQLGHDGLAVDPELFGELVDADLGHISPVSVRPDRVGPSLVLGTHRWVLIGACSSGSHRLPTRFPYRRSASPPGTTRRRPAPAAPRGGGAPRSCPGCPATRRARPNARRRSAFSRHPGSGCSHAPLPGIRRVDVHDELAVPSRRRPPSAGLTSGRWLGTPRTCGPDPCQRHVRVSVGSAGSTGGAGHPAQPQQVYRAAAPAASHVRSLTAVRTVAGTVGARALPRHLGVRADVDAPAGQLGGEAGVLALLADRERQLVVRHDRRGPRAPRGRRPSRRAPGRATARARPSPPGRRRGRRCRSSRRAARP